MRDAIIRVLVYATVIAAATTAIYLIPGTSVYEKPEATTVHATITAYTSDPAETDDTPFETASGSRTRRGVAANNCLLFGTRIIIEGEWYIVEDRMNSKYGCERYDIWRAQKDEAWEWGVRKLLVTIAN